MSQTETLTDLAVRLKMSRSWVEKHWRTIENLPRPFIGGEKHGRPRWRAADLDRYFTGAQNAAPEAATQTVDDTRPMAATLAIRPARPSAPANIEDPHLTALLRAAGG